MNDFRWKLVEQVKACGQELIDRAEDFVGSGDLVSDFTIWIRFPMGENPMLPTIEVQKEFCCKKAIEVMATRKG